MVDSHLWRPWEEENDEVTKDFRAQVQDIVEECRTSWESSIQKIGEDPWRDEEFPVRVVERIEYLTTRKCEVDLQPAEIALLLVSPFIREAVLSSAEAEYAEEADPHNVRDTGTSTGLRGNLENTFRAAPQHTRRAQRLEEDEQIKEHRAVATWLLHKCILNSPTVWTPESKGVLLPDEVYDALHNPEIFDVVRETLSLTKLRTFARWVIADLDRLEQSGQPDAPQETEVLAPGTARQTKIRESVVGALLALAGRLAIDPRTLSDVIVEHVGLSKPIDPASLVDTLGDATWYPEPPALALFVTCDHPALDLALREHVDAADLLLDDLSRFVHEDEHGLGVLEGLPKRLTDHRLSAAESNEGRPEYETPHLRFHLDQNEIQELLMGEQLYGDPSLAIRELYQNALDACRYRRARTQYLERTHEEYEREWTGHIEFRQGTEEGREYIECVDNGIGMGRRELAEAFAKAGQRFADLPEFIKEQAQWQRCDPPVEFWPNSQFGIGVFSYFMLSDELEIETCRFTRDGKPGDPLRVDVTGSGSLFRVRSAPGQRSESGTRIRLYLRPDLGKNVSCTETLRKILWIAEFPTEAHGTTERETWSPETLHEKTQGLKDGPNHVFYTGENVWLIRPITDHFLSDLAWGGRESSGRLLSDGIWTDETLTGAVVNLTAEHAPTLSVDRTEVVDYDDSFAEKSITRNIGKLAEQPEWFSMEWMWKFADAYPPAGEQLLNRLLEIHSGTDITLSENQKYTLLPSRVGCFPPDYYLYAPILQKSPSTNIPERTSRFPDWLLALRAVKHDGLTALRDLSLDALEFPVFEDIRLQPADVALLPSNDEVTEITAARILETAYRFDRTPAEILRRCQKLSPLGLSIPDVSPEEVQNLEVTETDAFLLSEELDGESSFVDKITPSHIIEAAYRLDHSPAEILQRFQRFSPLGLSIPEVSSPIEIEDLEITEEDSQILSSKGPFARTRIADEITPSHLLRVSHRLDQSPAEVLRRCQKLTGVGLSVPDVSPDELEELEIIETDFQILSQKVPFFYHRYYFEDITPAHIVKAALEGNRSPAEVLRRYQDLSSLGLTVPDVSPDEVRNLNVTETDALLLSEDLDGEPSFVDEITPIHIIEAAYRPDHSPPEILQRCQELSQLGLTVPDVSPDEVRNLNVTEADAFVLSEKLDGGPPFLDSMTKERLIIGAWYLDTPVPELVGQLRPFEKLGVELPDLDLEHGKAEE